MRSLAALSLAAAASVAHALPFKYRDYGDMVAYLLELNASYPEVLRVEVAQDKYALPSPPELSCLEHANAAPVPCKHYVVHMTNHSTLAAQPDRPQVFFSGALHGDERIGPITTIEMIALVAKLSTAYAHPESPEVAAVRNTSIHTQRWVHHLVNTRDVVLTPMTNAYGYSRNTRTELNVDPNRDYNYMRSGPHCMQTMTSRVVNEIWREHMFQLAITFHGGMRAISYEWGSPNHYLTNNRRSQKSPDDAAQAQLAQALAVFAGPFADQKLYPTGTMNDIVYGVTGGMEDWGYAASWENQFTPKASGNGEESDAHLPFRPCEPTTFGGYDRNKTIYNNVTHRAFNILVETSNNKHPTEEELGEFEDLYHAELDYYHAKKDAQPLGHVTQNVRLALMLMDMVQSYIRWVDAPVSLPTKEAAIAMEASLKQFPSASLFVEDGKQLTRMGCGGFAAESTQIASCNSTQCHVTLSSGKPLKLQLAWEVLGAITVDKTHVQLASDVEFSPTGIISQSTVQKGKTRRFFDLTNSEVSSESPDNADTLGTSLFVSCLDLHAAVSKKFYVRAVATVDQSWSSQASSGDDEPSPHIPPQSHYVNARTNPSWSKTWNGREIKGSKIWYSPIITVTIQSSSSEIDTTSDAGSNDSSSASGAAETSAPPQTTPSAPETTTEPTTTVTPTTTTTPMTTTTPSMTPGLSGQDDTDDESESNDDEVATEPEISPATTPTPTLTQAPTPTLTLAPTSTPWLTTASPSTQFDETLSGVLKNDAKKSADQPSLLQYGYMTLALGAVIISVTVAYMYKRVFRSQRRTYMNINQQRPQRSRFSRPVSPRDDDDDDDP